MKYTKDDQIALNIGSTRGWVYRLIEIDSEDSEAMAEWDNIGAYFDEMRHLDEDTVYIGLTNNPYQRFGKHRSQKGWCYKMEVFHICDGPAHAKFVEARAIYEYENKYGQVPELNKGGNTFAGA